jgi:hypothetical protein
MTRTAIMLAALLATTTAGFAAEDQPKEDPPKSACATGNTEVTGTTHCIQVPRSRTRRSTSTPDRPPSFLGTGYDARVMAPTYLPGTAR